MTVEELNPTLGLGSRAYRAAIFISAGRVVLLAVNTGQKILLARLLAPDQFGILGICLLVITLAETLSETGLTQAIIHERSVHPNALDTMWSVLFLRGILLAAITLLLADLIARGFFDEPGAVAPLQCLSLTFVLSGLVNPGLVLLRREIQFAPLVIMQFAEAITNLLFAVLLAFTLRNVWALVIAILAARAVRLIFSYLLVPSRPRFHVDLALLARLSRYGRWVSGNALLTYVMSTIDNVAVGRMLGAQQLGFYQAAFDFSHLPSTLVTGAAGEVAFPTYVKVRDHGEIGAVYLDVLRTVVFLSFPITGGIFLIAPAAVRIILGQPWEPMIPALQILAFVGMFRSISANSGALFSALGRFDIPAQQTTMRLIVTLVVLIPFTRHWGIEGTAAAVLLSALLIAPITWIRTAQLSKCGVQPFLKAIAVPFLNTAAMVAVVLGFRWWQDPPTHLITLILEAGLAVVSYGLFTVIWVVFFHYPMPHLPLSRTEFTVRLRRLGRPRRE